jgi:shikimate kinase/3-dehydroquinate synthase
VKDRVVLVGFMGAGKSTVGPLLAGRLGWTFRDMDLWIEERTGLRVPAFFRERGEEAFRREEELLAAEAARQGRLVLAAGGGAFASPRTRALLAEGALTVWLRCELDVALARIALGRHRPRAGDRETMAALLAEREPFYRLAEMMVDTSRTPPAETAGLIAAALALLPAR